MVSCDTGEKTVFISTESLLHPSQTSAKRTLGALDALSTHIQGYLSSENLFMRVTPLLKRMFFILVDETSKLW